ncbi:hypothetical protein ACIRNI_04645 [Streptomyces sp. NPDC093546]|uniref:hypothetical protein n=1 Tax=Streptomyces sp. NPDC093546 TaxID=3366040 RepID=UPI00382BB449
MQQMSEFLMTQKVTALVNRYVITSPDGGQVVAFAEQKRMKLKEEVTLWTGEDRSTVLARFKAQSLIDFGATYDVTGADGTPVGSFRKDGKASLLRSTWHLTQGEEPPVTGRERSQGIALARRAVQLADAVLPIPVPIPFVFHFDFAREDGRPVMAVERKWGLRDRYAIRVEDPSLDRRLALCLTVALDALQSR